MNRGRDRTPGTPGSGKNQRWLSRPLCQILELCLLVFWIPSSLGMFVCSIIEGWFDFVEKSKENETSAVTCSEDFFWGWCSTTRSKPFEHLSKGSEKCIIFCVVCSSSPSPAPRGSAQPQFLSWFPEAFPSSGSPSPYQDPSKGELISQNRTGAHSQRGRGRMRGDKLSR